MSNDQEVRVKLINKQLIKVKSAAKYKTETTLKITTKEFQSKQLPLQLLLEIRQKCKKSNAFNNNIPTEIILSNLLISKINQSGGFRCPFLGTLASPVMKIVVLLAKNIITIRLNGSSFRC